VPQRPDDNNNGAKYTPDPDNKNKGKNAEPGARSDGNLITYKFISEAMAGKTLTVKT